MKKFIFTALLAIAASLVITSCTEENVTPKTENGGGNTIDEKRGN